ncbi:MAG TPA: phosphohistidine phosphatase SixA [Planctomycetota bacterium]|nr:phosphohistidine phosphatase SixA [Planctomycetota bacterium]
MNLYLMRHGIAFDHDEWKGSDFDRPLTDEGHKRTQKVLSALRQAEQIGVDAIWSSPLVRARQTAEIAGHLLGLNVLIVEALECGCDLDHLLKYTKKNPPPARLLCVGHEPDCGAIVGELVGDEGGDYSFKRAGVAHLEGELKAGGMKLIWKYAPKDVLGD